MWMVRLIPIGSSIPSGELSYFSTERLLEGSIVRIPLRGKDSFGLVLESTSMRELRQDIKNRNYTLKKITAPAPAHILRRPLLRSIFEVSMQEAVSPSSILGTIIPNALLRGRKSVPEYTKEELEIQTTPEVYVYADTWKGRIMEYKRIIREALARGTSVLIITPTAIESEHLKTELESGIEKYTKLFHGKLSEKKLVAAWQDITATKHPLLIIGTPLALAIPRGDTSTIIVERENARSFTREERPHIRYPRLIEHFAHAIGARLILATSVRSVSHAHRLAEGTAREYIPLPRLEGIVPTIIDLRTYKKEKGAWAPLAAETLEHIERHVAEHKRVLILAARRGMSPMTVCDDCGTTLTCATCGKNLVLHKKNSPVFLCHFCEREESASVRCRNCSGWRLTTLGIGIDRVAEDVARLFPQSKRFLVTAEHTEATIRKQVETWEIGGGILLATELVLPYLTRDIPCIAVASIDSLLSIPEYTASERAFIFLAELRTRATSACIIQTRTPGHPVMRAIQESTYQPFLTDELKERTRFNYPPKGTIIRLTLSGKAERIQSEAKKLAQALTQLSPYTLEHVGKRKGEIISHIIIKLKEGVWVDQRLLRFIRTLPPSVSVRVNPENLHS